jgi:hypothetical protein
VFSLTLTAWCSSRAAAQAPTSQPTTASKPAPRSALPALPPGVVQLEFTEIFVAPVGRRGAEYTARARALDGQRVRMLGYMVRPAHEEHGHDHGHDHGAAGHESETGAAKRAFMLAPYALTINDAEYGLADDLPLNTVFVRITDSETRPIKYTPGPLLLTGTLELGRRDEADGRVSWVRLVLDPPQGDNAALAPPASQATAPGDKPHQH